MTETLARARAFERSAEAEILPEERPAFHLSPRTGWLNDPNGFSRYDGKYHLFYQYHPYSSMWGNIHWGHAVSSDLLHWEYLPAALAPDEPYDSFGCFSGGAAKMPDGRQLLMYTGVRLDRPGSEWKSIQTQCIAIGDGLDYYKFDGNPVLTAEDLPEGADPSEFRDPNLQRDGDGYRAIAANLNRLHGTQILQFRSEDGLHWKYDRILAENRGRIGEMWECPDFFELDGTQVLLASAMDMQEETLEFHRGNNTFCMVGEEQSLQTVDHGPDFYAAQTLLSPDGRRIMIGWMQNPGVAGTVDRKFFGQMSIPRELDVRGGRLCQRPIRELEDCRSAPVTHSNVRLDAEEQSLAGIRGRVLDLEFTVKAVDPDRPYREFRCRFAKSGDRFTELSYRPETQVLAVDRSASVLGGTTLTRRETRAQAEGGVLQVRMILDRYSVEVFVDQGRTVMSLTFYTGPEAEEITFSAEGGAWMDVKAFRLCNKE